jgi:outer membrane biosynthesis protein TonB
MMLLLGTGPLIGIISIYQPADIETQPQQEQPIVAPNQTVKKPPNLVQPKPQGQLESLLRNYLTGVWKGTDQDILWK